MRCISILLTTIFFNPLIIFAAEPEAVAVYEVKMSLNNVIVEQFIYEIELIKKGDSISFYMETEMDMEGKVINQQPFTSISAQNTLFDQMLSVFDREYTIKFLTSCTIGAASFGQKFKLIQLTTDSPKKACSYVTDNRRILMADQKIPLIQFSVFEEEAGISTEMTMKSYQEKGSKVLNLENLSQ